MIDNVEFEVESGEMERDFTELLAGGPSEIKQLKTESRI